MRKLLYAALIGAFVLSLGCAITNYPVMYDDAGAADDFVVDSWYDKAYIIPSGGVATLWPDGSDELFTLVAQNWTGDQTLYTYNNYDPSSALNFLDQTYCDPTNQDDCAIWTASNPDLPDAYPFGEKNGMDDIFDGVYDGSCFGSRSLSILVSYGSRIGECGSGFWAEDKQGTAFELSILEQVEWRGATWYHLPVDSSLMSVEMTDMNGNSTMMPIFGRYNGYFDEYLRLAIPVTPNARYQMRWLNQWLANHGNFASIDITYGSVTANYEVNIEGVQNALGRL
jgi:hypothetical protein